jgi:alpha-1,2-mannosyltransferase
VPRATRRPIRIAVAAVIAAGLLVLVAKVVGRWYYDPTLFTLAGWVVPPDLRIFLNAGDAVLAGRSPYVDIDVIGDNLRYVYPPLLAFVMTPLSVLPLEVATIIWTLLSGAFVLGALYLFGVRDWRCYPVALLIPFTRESFEFGTIGPLLLLVVAACWRYRDRRWGGSSAAAVAVALKLFLWPLVLWLAVTRRLRAAVLSVGITLALVFLPWALIGFAGLGQYPALLRKVADQQDYRSYSLVALGEALGASPTAAKAISIAVGVALLVLAARAARARRGSADERDRRSLIFVLAAALALTPVIWAHYLVLLIAPVALARPRLSPLWLVLLAATVLYLFDWYRQSPEGEVRPTVTIAALVVGVFVASLRRPHRLVPEARHAQADPI